MENKRILVIDDDPDLLFLMAHGIKRLNSNFQVSTAPSATVALEQMQNQQFDLVVTDYMMPDMTGLDLVPKIRQISPQTKFVVVTAHHDTNRIRDMIDDLKISGFLGKPFVLPELLEVIQKVTSQTEPPPATAQPAAETDPALPAAVVNLLANLRHQTNARMVLLLNADGSPLHVVGENNPAIIAQLALVVSSNFSAITKLAGLFGDKDAAFKTNYYEGTGYNIYASNLDGDNILSVIFGPEVKPGSVWFYTKQTAAALLALLPAASNRPNHSVRSTLAKDFEALLGKKPAQHG